MTNGVKANSDGLSKVNPGISACGAIFRTSSSSFLGCFAVSLGLHTAFYAELVAVLNVIDIAYSRNWLNLWIECDSPSVASSLVNRDYHPPWSLRNSWLNCLDKITRMRVQVTHIFREGKKVADKLANMGLNHPTLSWWDMPPLDIQPLLIKDSCGLPNFRFS